MAVIDITTFRLADGVGEDAFLAIDERVRTGDLYNRPEFVRATTARADDGGWAVIVLWGSADDAVDLMTTELASVADTASVERRQYTTLD
ncbi:MAG: hypothetical protein QOG87_3612 [Actinomycetota bacterium]|jgi:hypothetical protein